MKFDEFDEEMRAIEKDHEMVAPAGKYIIVRVDGRGFTNMTKTKCDKPFDEDFWVAMCFTISEIMDNSGFNIIYAYTQSDEASFVIHPKDSTFGRRLTKISSVFAGTMSGLFSCEFGTPVAFDGRAAPYTKDEARNYLLWRRSDAIRNALNTTCYWTVRKGGYSIPLNDATLISAKRATKKLFGLGYEEKLQLLKDEYGIDYLNDVSQFEREGVGTYWKPITRVGVDLKTGEPHEYTRRTQFILPYYQTGDNNSIHYREQIEEVLDVS